MSFERLKKSHGSNKLLTYARLRDKTKNYQRSDRSERSDRERDRSERSDR